MKDIIADAEKLLASVNKMGEKIMNNIKELPEDKRRDMMQLLSVAKSGKIDEAMKMFSDLKTKYGSQNNE